MDEEKLKRYIDVFESLSVKVDVERVARIENYIKSRFSDYLGYLVVMFVVGTTIFFEEVMRNLKEDRDEVFASLFLSLFGYFIRYGSEDRDVEITIEPEKFANLVFELNNEVEDYTYFDLMYLVSKYFGAGIVVMVYRLEFFRKRLSKFINFDKVDKVLFDSNFDA